MSYCLIKKWHTFLGINLLIQIWRRMPVIAPLKFLYTEVLNLAFTRSFTQKGRVLTGPHPLIPLSLNLSYQPTVFFLLWLVSVLTVHSGLNIQRFGISPAVVFVIAAQHQLPNSKKRSLCNRSDFFFYAIRRYIKAINCSNTIFSYDLLR